jgi:phosphoglycerol transferase MdoB-like AlkP superfamily enzyme
VLNTPFSVFRTYNKKSFERKTYFDNEASLNEAFPAVKQPNPAHPFRYDNVVIFIMESWGKENSGLLNPQLENGKYLGYTPFLDSLIKDGLSFKYSFANGKKSIDGMPSVLASVPSMQTPYVLTHQSDNRINSIASLLKPKGYSSAFFHGAPNGSMGFQAFANIAGFDKYYGKTEYNNDADADGYWGIWDEEFFQYFARTMNEMKPPFVTALFSVSSHHPYKVPERYEGKLREGPLPIFRSVNYTDNALKKFFESASKMPWFQNTLFVFTADHTQSHAWHEEYKNNTGYFSIPIVFYKPDGSLRNYDTQRVVQQIDIMPTILGYLGYDQPYVAFGNDIFSTPPESGFAVNYQNDTYQWFAGNHVLLSNGETIYGVYDFTTDPAMTTNISPAQQALAGQLETRLHGFIQQYNNRMLDNKLVIKQ